MIGQGAEFLVRQRHRPGQAHPRPVIGIDPQRRRIGADRRRGGRPRFKRIEIELGFDLDEAAQFFGAPSNEKMGAAPVNAAAPPGGDPSGGGLFDPAFLGAQSKSVTLEPLPKPKLPPKDLP